MALNTAAAEVQSVYCQQIGWAPDERDRDSADHTTEV